MSLQGTRGGLPQLRTSRLVFAQSLVGEKSGLVAVCIQAADTALSVTITTLLGRRRAMQVKESMTFGVEMIDSDAKLVEAAQKMKTIDVGALPVMQNESIVGMLTDRDITVRATAEGKDATTTPVSEIMTPHMHCCYESDDVYEAARMMEEKSVHRLLVLNHRDRPVGFISLADFAVKIRDEHLAWEVLERISEPACPSR
jgi:CBS domain-containing protein